MLTLLALLACSTRPVTTAPEATPPVPVEAAGPIEAAARRRTITLDPEEMSYDEATGTATFSPGSRMQAASYTTYVLDLRGLEAALGGRPDAPVAVEIEVSDEKTENYKPSDPNLPSPMGGFDYITITARVIGRAP